MTRGLFVALLIVIVGLAGVLVSTGASAVTYNQAGYDAGRTGAVPFDLPRANDTAFEVDLPGTPTGTVAIDGSTAYVVTLDRGLETRGGALDENALWSIDVDTAEVTKRFEIFEERPAWSTAFTDGKRVYAQVERAVTAYSLDGDELWTWQLPNELPMAEHVTCFDDPALREGVLYLACLELRERYAQGQETDEVPHTALSVAALDVASGDAAWVWTESADDTPSFTVAEDSDGPIEEQTPPETRDVLNAEVTVAGSRVLVYAMAHDRERAYTAEGNLEVEGQVMRFYLWGLSAEDGRFELLQETSGRHARGADSFLGNDTAANPTHRAEGMLDGKVAAHGDRGLLGWGQPLTNTDTPEHLRSFNLETGDEVWQTELPASHVLNRLGSHGIGAREETVLATSHRAIVRLAASTGVATWEAGLPSDRPLSFGTDPIVSDTELAVAETRWYQDDEDGLPQHNRSGYGLIAFDLETGEQRWHHALYTPTGEPEGRYVDAPAFEEQGISSSTPGYGSGVIIAPRLDGHVEVLGETPVSMGAPEVDPERFPAVDENVTLDLSDTEPGAFGEATRYRVEWGDGTVDGWQDSPTFSHAYEEEGNVTARLFAGNDANQTASTDVVMRVGQTEPNFIETAFKQDNQDMTFGVLGLAVALTGGAIGVARRYRERSRLQEELDAIEALYHETKDRPAECEAQLTERKAHARGLLTDGYLTEEQFSVAESRIEELKRELRLGAVEEEFGFLPYTLVTEAREMLEDGRVTSLEARAFLTALEESDVITDEQRALVRERIEQWFARDAGGRAQGDDATSEA